MNTCPTDQLARKALRGTAGENESELPPNPPKCLVRQEARDAYRMIRLDSRVQRRGDYDLVVALCLAVQRLHEATWLLQSDGLCTTTEKGEIRAHPAVGIADRASSTIATFAAKLGMSHAARQLAEPVHLKPEAKRKADSGGIRLVS